jgi:hypothetical protein
LRRAHDRVGSDAAFHLRARQTQRGEELSVFAKEVEMLRENAYDCGGCAVERHCLPDDLPISREATLPRSIAEEHDRCDLIHLVLGIGERAPHDRLHRQRSKHRG